MDFKTVKPEELCDPTLIGYVTKLLKNEGAFPEIFAAAYENRNANNLVFSVPSDLRKLCKIRNFSQSPFGGFIFEESDGNFPSGRN